MTNHGQAGHSAREKGKKVSALLLENKQGTLKAEITPSLGGMSAQLTLEGKKLLHLNRQQLQTAPMAAGGMPILFPFAGRTEGDSYLLQGKRYEMPMHGLVKNDVFAVSCVGKEEAVLWLEGSPSWREQYYPFDFRLEVTYRLCGNCLAVSIAVTNRSEEPLPHALGLHPFFRATDKKRTAFCQDMCIHHDYEKCKDEPGFAIQDLSLYWDDVFAYPRERGFIFTNLADGYQVRCEPDPQFEALVVCSWVEESICAEPWCALPNSINTGRFLKWVAPGETKTYGVQFFLELLK